MSLRALLVLSLSSCVCVLAGCGDDTSGADGGAGASGTSGDGDGDPCDIDRLQVTEPDEHYLSNLSVSGDTLVFLSVDLATFLGTIESVATNGEGQQTLHTPEGQRRVRSVMAYEDTIYFLEENEEIVSTYELFAMPLEGGTPERIGDSGVSSGMIFGIDDTHVFTWEGSVVRRIAIDGGAVERVGSLAGGGTASNMRLSGDDIFFMSGMTGSNAGMRATYRLDKTATDAEAEKLWDFPQQGDPCFNLLGGLFATPTKLVCGYFSLASRDRDGTMEEILFDGDVLTGPKNPLAVDGENVYYGGTQEPPSPLTRMTSAGEDHEVIVCDTGTIGTQVLDGFFPIQNAYEMVVGDTEIYWVEQIDSDGDATFIVRRAAK